MIIRSLLECNFVWGGVVWVCDGFILIMVKVTAAGRGRQYIIFLWLVVCNLWDLWRILSGEILFQGLSELLRPTRPEIPCISTIRKMLAFKPALDVVTSRKRQTEGLPAEQKGQDCNVNLQRVSKGYKGMNKHAIMPMCWIFFSGARRFVFSIYFLHKNCGNFSHFFSLKGNWVGNWSFFSARRRSCRWWFLSVCKICWRCFLRGLGYVWNPFRLKPSWKLSMLTWKFMVGRCNFLLK